MASVAGASGGALTDLLIEITGDLEVGAGAAYPLSDALRTGSFHHWTTAPHPALAEAGPWYVNYAFAIQTEFEGGTALSAYVPPLPAGRDSVLFRLDSADAAGRLLRIGAIVGRNARWEYTKSQQTSLGNGTMCAWVWSRERCEPVRSDTAAGTPGGSIRFRVWRASGSNAHVITHRETGVVGATLTDSVVPAGSLVSYSFQAQPGFDNVLVTLDGRPVPADSSFQADSSHLLHASARRIVVLPSNTSGVYAAARALLTAGDKHAAMQAYLDEALAYRDANPGSADGVLQDVEYMAYQQSAADQVAFEHAMDALRHHVFRIGSAAGSPSARRGAAGLSLRAQDGGELAAYESTTFLYVNGINTPSGKTATTGVLLDTLIMGMPEFSGATGTIDILWFINRTLAEQPESPANRSNRCWRNIAQIAWYAGANAKREYMAICTADSSYRAFSDKDLVEAFRQWLTIQQGQPAAEEDAIRLADAIQERRDVGRHVIVVPHSQGNLMTHQAIGRLRSHAPVRYRPDRDSTCIGAVALASPTNNGWILPPRNLRYVSVAGDLVPILGLNDEPVVYTSLWSSLNDIASFIPDPAKSVYLTWAGYKLHDVVESYLGSAGAQGSVQDALLQTYRACTIDRIATDPDSLPPGTPGVNGGLIAYALNVFGDTLFGRFGTWSVDDSTVVSITEVYVPYDSLYAYAYVRAEGVGSTILRYRTRTREIGMPLHVVPDSSGSGGGGPCGRACAWARRAKH